MLWELYLNLVSNLVFDTFFFLRLGFAVLLTAALICLSLILSLFKSSFFYVLHFFRPPLVQK